MINIYVINIENISKYIYISIYLHLNLILGAYKTAPPAATWCRENRIRSHFRALVPGENRAGLREEW